MLAVVVPERPGRRDDGPAPGRDARRAARHRGLRQVGVTDLQIDCLDATTERVGGDLGQSGPRTGTDVGGTDLDHIAALFGVGDTGGVAVHCHPGVRRGSHPGPDEPTPRQALGGAGISRRPAEPFRAELQALDEVTARPGLARFGIDVGFVA